MLAKDREHRKELEAVRLKAKADAYDKLTSLAPIGAPANQQEPIVKKVSNSSAPLLSVAYNEFLSGHTANKKKLETFRKLFISFVGDKKIDQLTQIEVNEFFFLLIKCPGGRGGKRWHF